MTNEYYNALDHLLNSPRLAADLARHGRMNDATAAMLDVEATDVNELETETEARDE